MKKTKQAVCPGCSRHCTADKVRCKHGRAYFAKLSDHNAKEGKHPRTGLCRKHKHKWERDVEQGGMLWHMLSISRRIKKALHKGDIAESQLLNALSESEKTQLAEILRKMNGLLAQE